ncbi:ABC transporter permease subunit [Arsukibacterium perlucidum]|uniref:ABC transporter permease subunit n=1 Tax=Arsukibacterium perlucidum TaxID=368811 RepID=UPI000374BCA7|nr:ABC transporter permease subunit [Arsukibacterium perlucidum]
MSIMLLLRQIRLFSQVELSRLWLTRRGLMTLAATAVVWFFLLRYAIAPASEILQEPNFQKSLTAAFGMLGLHQLLNWPAPELTLYWMLSLVLLPFLSLVFTANQLSSDAARGTLRFISLRSSRTAIVLGRFCGQLVVQLCLILLSLTATLIISAVRQDGLNWQAIEAALLISCHLLIVLMPFTALMTVFSALARSSRLALSLAIVSLGVVFGLLSWLIYHQPDAAFLLEYMPGAQIWQLIPAQGWQSLQLAALPLAQTAVLLLIAQQILSRRAL